ncbi:hypothetical protein FDECE_16005 [Fusarium decemcellulare]|nr:hypothetical protein FDECE_16005 [Fusarium decemcellulare]
MRSRLLPLAAAACLAHLTLACQTDEDCTLNGICSANGKAQAACVCDAGWRGSDCSALDLRPAKRASGYNRTEEGISSWGGTIVRDRQDPGLFHLILAEFANNCGLDYWSPYSKIVRAESRTGPEGPYKFMGDVVGTFSHNPTVIWSQSDSKYLMYYIGCPQVIAEGECAPPSFTCTAGNYINGESGISVASSRNLQNWTTHGPVLAGEHSDAWDACVTNPSPFPLYEPGNQTPAMLLVYRGCPVNCRDGWERINVAHAPSGFLGPYKKTSSEPLFMDSNEDPFVWKDKRGNWHMLLHSLEEGGGFGDGPNVGRHAFARNWEGPWTFVHQTLAYDTTIQYNDGTEIVFHRRERPQLFFSDDGNMTPLFLTTGAQPKDSPQSYTAIAPIGDAGAGFSQEQAVGRSPSQHGESRHDEL